jgi:hypothetical protein
MILYVEGNVKKRRFEMIKVYGMDTCPACVEVHKQIEGNKNFEFIDIGKHVLNLKEFLRLRDKESVFDDAKNGGYIGIPCFVSEDKRVSLDPKDVGLLQVE